MHRVTFHAQRQALDERRPAALARLLDRCLRLSVDGEDVGAVDDDAVEAVRGGAVGDVLDRVAEVGRSRVRPLVVVADEHHGKLPDAGHVHALVRVSARGRAFAEPPERDAAIAADLECQRHSDGDRQHRREMADHRVESELGHRHVHVPVAAARRTALAAHVLREDAPGLDAAGDVDAHVAVQRRPDVVRAHRRGDTHGRGLVAAPRVERARDLALPVEDVAALLDPARDQQVPVDAEQVLAVESRLLHLLERAYGLGFTYGHAVVSSPRARVAFTLTNGTRLSPARLE